MNRKALVVGLGVLLLSTIGVIAATRTRDMGTIETARIRGDEAAAIYINGRELGLICFLNTIKCTELIARAEKNHELKEAFLKAKTAGVRIIPEFLPLFSIGSVGSVGEGYVTVNTWYSDEEIIEFLVK